MEELTTSDIKLVLTQAIQDMLDRKAQEKGYDSILSVCSYVDTGVARFDQDGEKARRWRSQVWAQCYLILEQVENGQRNIPSVDELFDEMPLLEW